MWWPSLGRKRRRCCGLALLVLTTSLLLQAIEARAHGAAAADSPDLNEIEPYAERSGVAGESVHLPCPTKTKSNNSVVLVLWYKELILEPIYVFDIRRSMAEPKRRSSPKALGNRAYFNENMEPAQLIIKNLMPNDEGLYTCRVDFANSPTTSHKFNLTVIEKPSKPEILDGATRLPIRDIQKVYNEGSDISLICRTRGGNPAPQVVWFHGGQKIDDSFEHRPDNDETLNHLLFTKVGRQHLNSQLVCQASNTNKSSPQSAILNLDINLKPTDAEIVTKEPKFMAGNKFELECRSTGSKPNAVITWWMANKRIDNQTESYSKNNQSVSILKFVPSIDDEGKYLTCRAENPNMEDSAIEDRLQLNVQYQPVVNLRLGAKLDPDVIKEGDDVYFECSVRANPKPYKLAWYKDSVEMRNNQSAGIVLSDRSLVLRGVTRNSAGDYACLAANSEGKTYSNPVPLRVMYAPVCKEGRSEVVVGALKQETVSLLCGVESHPEPLTFHWTFNNSGEPIEMPSQPQARSGGNSHAASSTGSPPSLASQQQQQQQGESAAGVLKEYHGARMNYTPATEMDYGTVACWASNKVGRQRSPCMFQVIAAGRPNALHNCTATEMSRELDEPRLNGNNIPTSTATGTGLLVTCLEGYNGGLPIKSYHVDVVSDEDGGVVILNRTVEAAGSRTGAVGPGGGGGGGGLLQQTSGVDSSATIEVAGLSTGKSYRLFLYAVNAKGRSEPAMLEHVTLKGVAMYTTGNADISAFSPLLLGLAATATLLALAVAGILAALYRKHSGGLAGSPKHAPIVCEPPNAGSTTPVHPQTKQPIDDIDPDIIPNEYERRPLTYTSAVYKTPPQRRRRDRGGGGGGGSSSPEELNSTSPEKKPMVVQPVQPQPLPPQQQHLLSHRPSLDSGEMALLAEHNTPAPTIPRTYVPNHHPGYATHRVLASPPGGSGGYSLSPTLADFKQMAFDAYNQRQNVYYSLQRASSALSTMPQQRPLPSSQSIHGKIHQPVTEVVTRSNRVQESCI